MSGSQEWVPPPPDDKKPVDPNTPKCVACGGYHGGVNRGILCLEAAVRLLRNRVWELEKRGDAPSSPVELYFCP